MGSGTYMTPFVFILQYIFLLDYFSDNQLNGYTCIAIASISLALHLPCRQCTRTCSHLVLLVFYFYYNFWSHATAPLCTACQNAGILLDNRRGMDLRANNNFRNSEGKTENELLCLVVTPLKLRHEVTYGHTGALIGISSFPYFQLYSESPDRSGCNELERSYCLWKEPY